jgi:hypothetical protein
MTRRRRDIPNWFLLLVVVVLDLLLFAAGFAAGLGTFS